MPTVFATAEDAEKAFYDAFNRCDPAAMGDVWAEDSVVCVHPGSPAIVGNAAVIRSWTHILGSARSPGIEVSVISRISTETLAVHLVEEKISSSQQSVTVLATNVYRKFESGWRMIEHHGSMVHDETAGHTLQ